MRISRAIIPLLLLLISGPSGAFPFTRTDFKLWDDGGDCRSRVYLSAFIPSDGETARKAVVICPGGSYFWLARETEGEEVAKWLCDEGIAAFVLSYRVAGKFNFICDTRFLYNGNRYPAMLEDASRAIKFVRDGASEFGVNPGCIGIMGFSAGGHLAMLTAETEFGEGSSFSPARPDFVCSVYPVVSMSDKRIVHKRSKRGLLGIERGNAAVCEKVSLEKNVPHCCCPVFLVHCEDDRVVNYRNSEVLDSALTVSNIKHQYIRYPVGGHGFGINKIEDNGVIYAWTVEFLSWLDELFPKSGTELDVGDKKSGVIVYDGSASCL